MTQHQMNEMNYKLPNVKVTQWYSKQTYRNTKHPRNSVRAISFSYCHVICRMCGYVCSAHILRT